MRVLMISYTDIGSSNNMKYSFEEKKKGLEKFLNDLLKSKEFSSVPEVLKFLNFSDVIPS